MTTKSPVWSPKDSMNRLRISPSSLSLSRHLARHSGKHPPAALFSRLFALPISSCFFQFCYFLSLSFVGYCTLKSLTTRRPPSDDVPRTIDLFFTAVSATTGSSMSTVEMEVFSDSQLLFMTFLMLVGGEVFTSLAGLIVKNYRMKKEVRRVVSAAEDGRNGPTSFNSPHELELGVRVVAPPPPPPTLSVPAKNWHRQEDIQFATNEKEEDASASSQMFLRQKSIQFLCCVTSIYLTSTHVLGVSSLSLYLALEPSARDVLREKEIKTSTFSLFTVVSTFANCGFVPTNENMIVFRKNTIMLLVLVPQVLLGNTLFPPCLRLCLRLTGKLFPNSAECSEFLLTVDHDDGAVSPLTNGILLPARRSAYLAATVAGFVAVQVVMLCGLDWNSEGMKGLSSAEKLVGGTFVAVNSRHAGESVMDLSTLSPAVLVVFVVMMHLPPYTSFLPTEAKEEEEERNPHSGRIRSISGGIIPNGKDRKGANIVEKVILSQLSFLAVFVVMVCITEREKLQKDPLNFNVFNIALEVVSAYGNVGFSMGYSCKRRINPSGECEDKWYGFAGRWSDQGKIVLILVMLFGKLKKFNVNGGKAWKLS